MAESIGRTPDRPHPPERGKVIAIPQLGGLHHSNCREAWILLEQQSVIPVATSG